MISETRDRFLRAFREAGIKVTPLWCHGQVMLRVLAERGAP